MSVKNMLPRSGEWLEVAAYAVLASIALMKGGQKYLAVAGYAVLVASRFREDPEERLRNLGDFVLLASLSFQDPRQIAWIAGYLLNWALATGYGSAPIAVYHAAVAVTAPGGLESVARTALALYWSLH
jgi:hypothetical protein